MELDMTKGSPLRLIVRFIIPIIIGNIFQQLYSMIDTIIVGRFVGVHALAAVGATGTISFLIIGFAQGLTAGFTVITGQRYGAQDIEGVKKSAGSAVVLTTIVTIVMTIVSIVFMRPLLTVMNTPEDIYELSWVYIVIICAGMAGNLLYNLLSSLLRAVGNSKVPLYFLVVSAFLNIVLDLFLIVVIPLGVAGAAYATIISQLISGVLCQLYIIKKVPVLKLERRHLRFDGHLAGIQIKIGVPMALQFSITAVGTILVQSALNLLGSTVVAAYTAACKVEQLMTQPYGAMGMTMATYGAQNRGVNDLERIKKGVRIANVLSVIYSVLIYGVVILLLPYLIRLFVSGDITEVLEYARIYILVCGAFFIPLGMIFIFRNIMQGCGFGFWPMMGGVVEFFSRAALAIVAARQMSYVGVCFANVAAWFSAGVFLAIAYVPTMKKMFRDRETARAQRAARSETTREHSPSV